MEPRLLHVDESFARCEAPRVVVVVVVLLLLLLLVVVVVELLMAQLTVMWVVVRVQQHTAQDCEVMSGAAVKCGLVGWGHSLHFRGSRV